MDLAEAESLVERFIERHKLPLEGLPPRWKWKVRRPISDEDLCALDAVMRALLGLDDFGLRRLARNMGVKVTPARHRWRETEYLRTAQHRWAIFEHLKCRLLDLREEHGTNRPQGVSLVVPEGTEEEGQAASGLGRPVGCGQVV